MTNRLGSVFGLASPNPYAEPSLCNWQGASSYWFIHNVYPLTRTTFVQNANYIFARREWDGRRTALYIGESKNLAERLPNHHKLEAAFRLGANELHVHFLAGSDSERLHIETDLRNGHRTILNDQPSLAGIGGVAFNPFGRYDDFFK